jgi:NitT/TauT family transport system ATP-binding protein
LSKLPPSKPGTDIIQLKNVSKIYPNTSHAALTDINFLALAGEFIVLIGPSGCGKSTMAKLVTGLEDATDGEVKRPEHAAMVFQSGALFPWLTVADNISLVLRERLLSASQITRKVRLYLEMVGLSEFANKYPRELSGGQRQRVGLARALAVEPEVLVLDEPFAALDIRTTDQLHADLLKIWTETKKTIIMVSHSIEEAVTLADRVVLMNNGHIVRSYHLSDMARPRREQAHSFIEQVQAIRRDFLGLGD